MSIDKPGEHADLAVPASLAPVLGARRDGRAGVDSTRGLLLTILGEFVLPHGGSAWTQSILGLTQALGIQDKAARQALARMDERGWLTRERIGRQTRWSLTERSRSLLETGAERIYSFGRQDRPWDETWLVILASVPERDRQARYRMGVGLRWAGFGSVGQGVWLSPWVEQEPVAAELLTGLGINATSFRATGGQLGSGAELANQAWDLALLKSQYEAFLRRAQRPEQDGVDPAVTLVQLVHHWRRFPLLDPDLPRALLPPDWPGTQASETFTKDRAASLADARLWWRTAEESAGPA